MAEDSTSDIPELIEKLESDDAFERREAQQELSRRTHLEFGYRWGDPEADRASAVRRWKAWWQARRKGRQSRKGRSKRPGGSGMTIDLKSAVIGLDQLKHALKGIPPEKLEEHLTEILHKMQEAEASRSACDRCGEARATVHITERGPDGVLHHRDLCEDCFGAA